MKIRFRLFLLLIGSANIAQATSLLADDPMLITAHPASLLDASNSFPTDTAAQYDLARKLLKSDSQKAFTLMKAAADQGYAEAFAGMGFFHGSGLVVEKDTAAAREWFQKGADRGSARAQLNLGMLLLDSATTANDKAAALKWVEAAASQQLPQAQNAMGEMLETGTGCEKNTTRAIEYYRQAAQRGFSPAASHLGKILDPATNPDPAQRVEAISWLMIAASCHDPASEEALANLPFKSHEQEMSEARKKAVALLAGLAGN
ncbi:MAG: tetratricopeptide repeat protein [Chthoniobacterales bacterium]